MNDFDPTQNKQKRPKNVFIIGSFFLSQKKALNIRETLLSSILQLKVVFFDFILFFIFSRKAKNSPHNLSLAKGCRK